MAALAAALHHHSALASFLVHFALPLCTCQGVLQQEGGSEQRSMEQSLRQALGLGDGPSGVEENTVSYEVYPASPSKLEALAAGPPSPAARPRACGFAEQCSWAYALR